jgi:hypothetical protein
VPILVNEIEKRGLDEIPIARLHSIAAGLRAEIKQEVGTVRFSETNSRIPSEEYVIARHDWEV